MNCGAAHLAAVLLPVPALSDRRLSDRRLPYQCQQGQTPSPSLPSWLSISLILSFGSLFCAVFYVNSVPLLQELVLCYFFTFLYAPFWYLLTQSVNSQVTTINKVLSLLD